MKMMGRIEIRFQDMCTGLLVPELRHHSSLEWCDVEKDEDENSMFPSLVMLQTSSTQIAQVSIEFLEYLKRSCIRLRDGSQLLLDRSNNCLLNSQSSIP